MNAARVEARIRVLCVIFFDLHTRNAGRTKPPPVTERDITAMRALMDLHEADFDEVRDVIGWIFTHSAGQWFAERLQGTVQALSNAYAKAAEGFDRTLPSSVTQVVTTRQGATPNSPRVPLGPASESYKKWLEGQTIDHPKKAEWVAATEAGGS